MDLTSRLPKDWRTPYRAKKAVAMPWVRLPALMSQQVMRVGMRKQTDLALPGLKAQPMAKQVKKALVLKTPQAKRAVLRVNQATKLAMM
jgi:hypothetical protein